VTYPLHSPFNGTMRCIEENSAPSKLRSQVSRPKSRTPNSHLRKASHTCMALIIRSSAIHAAGCYTTTPIRKGRRVAEYTGPVSARTRQTRRMRPRPSPTYLDWGVARSSSTATVWPCSSITVATPTARPAKFAAAFGSSPSVPSKQARKSLTTTAFTTAATDEAICNCGAKNCRGTMYSKEEIRRRKAAAKKAAASTTEKSSRKPRGGRSAGKSGKAAEA